MFENNESIIDFRQGTNHPCSFLYSEIYSNALLNGKLEDGRLQPGFSLKSKSPFVLAAKRAVLFGVEKENAINEMEKVFTKYYEMVRPQSAAEWLGLDLALTNKLAVSPPWAAVFPWRARTLASYRQAYEEAALKDNLAVGVSLGIKKGWFFCGPVSFEKIKIEALRMAYVLRQISEEGYQRSNSSDGDVKATALVDDTNQWRWLITSGTHRASAASALGYEEIPIRVNLVIRRMDAAYWPNVVNGLYNEVNALKVFDSYFNGVASPVTDKWISSEFANNN